MSPKPVHSRQQRWEEINEVLEKSKSKKHGMKLIKPIFDNICRPYVEQIKAIPESDFKILSTMLGWIIKCLNHDLFCLSNEAKRRHLIAPVLWSVAQLLPDVAVNTECDLSGKRVHAHGPFLFLLTRGTKRVCVSQPVDDFGKAVIQTLLGCEVGILRLRI